jgi:predicted lipoprotein with Yx(FWY)xxD motif
VQYPDAGSSAIVHNDTDGESACKKTCQRHEAPLEENQPAG